MKLPKQAEYMAATGFNLTPRSFGAGWTINWPRRFDLIDVVPARGCGGEVGDGSLCQRRLTSETEHCEALPGWS
jgi:hypothetical protein